MLDSGQLLDLREEFMELLHNIKRTGCDLDGLVGWLETHGFFKAPATKEYYCSFEGGLMFHSINVYKALRRLSKGFASKDDNGTTRYRYNDDTLLIVGLLHAICKSDSFEKCSRNEKVYSKYGKTKDAIGYYNWESRLGYKVVDDDKREIFGNSGFSSYYIISSFIPLTQEESIVLANFNELLSDEANKPSMYQILSKYPLASLLISASNISAYCTENPRTMEF